MLEAGLTAENGIAGRPPAHARSLQQPNGRCISSIRDSDHSLSLGVLKYQVDGDSNGDGGDAASLRRSSKSYPDFSVLTVPCHEQTNVSQKRHSARVGNVDLGPNAWLKQFGGIHLGEER